MFHESKLATRYSIHFFIRSGQPALSSTFVFSDGNWNPEMDLPDPRRQLAAVAVSDSDIMLCGGKDIDDVTTNECWLYHHTNGSYTSIQPLNVGRWSHSLGVVYQTNGTR